MRPAASDRSVGEQAADRRTRRRDKARAILASGSVLGLGAVGTVASWNDNQHATAALDAGQFILTSSSDGQEFSQHDLESPASMNLNLPDSGITPGETAHVLFSVATHRDSVGGAVTPTADAENTAGLGQHLTYGVRALPSGGSPPSCTEETFAASDVEVVPLETSLDDDGGPESSQHLESGGSNQVDFCFAVTLPTAAAEGAAGSSVDASWELTGTYRSESPTP